MLTTKLDSDGLICPGKNIEDEEILVGKTMKPSEKKKLMEGNVKSKDVSLRSRRAEKGIVDMVIVSENFEGKKIAKVRVRSIRIPQIGDKFASRHGQKGTCGMTYRQEDLPFTIDGIVPDMIVNPQQSISGELRSTGNVIAKNRPPIVEVEEFYTGRLIFD